MQGKSRKISFLMLKTFLLHRAFNANFYRVRFALCVHAIVLLFVLTVFAVLC